jgi:hypothetical protein
MIPKILHFCWTSPRSGGKPWSLSHYVCVRSAVERIRPERALFHYENEPTGPWWALTRPLLTLVQVEAPRTIFGNPVRHVAHRADVLRQAVLLEHGGIYLDNDVFVHRDFDDLLGNAFVMGREGEPGQGPGLCNAVVLSEPGAPFLRRWREEYRTFRSTGHDQYWNEHSVKVPLRLMQENPAEITVLSPKAFFWPRGKDEEIKLIFGPSDGRDVRGLYANHLWETLAWWQWLKDLTPGRVRREDTPFHEWVRPYVADLPDRYGAPGLAELIGRKLRHYAGRMGLGRNDGA